MPLRAKNPESIQKRLKALFYGGAGVGKTMASISFPRPYLIDTEKGSENDQYIKLLSNNGGVVFQTSDFDEMLEEIKTLISEKHDYKTLIIDPLTTIYNDLLDKSSVKVGTEFGRHYGEANKSIKHMLNLLLRLDMNVIITSHSKNEYGDNFKILGTTYDCYKKLDYLFDIVFEIQNRGNDRVGIVKKSRISSFLYGEQFPFSYETISDKYGKEVLERNAVPVNLSTKEQVDELTRLVDLMKVPEEIYIKWLHKSESSNFSEMSSENIQKCIDLLNKKLTNQL